MSDKQTDQFSSYSMINVFTEYDWRKHFKPSFSFFKKDTPEVREDLKNIF